MANIAWCKKQKKGLKLIEPNEDLAKEYLREAEETLEILKGLQGKSKTWLAVTKYYCEYFSVYALLMKMGLKSEIHDCTIEVCRMLEKEGIIPSGCADTLENDKDLRIDNQYYLKNKEVPLNYDALVNFVLTMKNKVMMMTEKEIKKIRKLFI